jgi:hypothetical protein
MGKRTAQCACGRLQVNVEQEPFRVTACYCDFCQKRTGSVFYVGAYFIQGAGIEIKGETQIYNGMEIDGVGTTTGDEINYHFCPTCGSTVFYTVQGHPIMGIAVGNFVDPSFPTPTMEFNVGMRPHWLPPIPSAEQFETFPENPREEMGAERAAAKEL